MQLYLFVLSLFRNSKAARINTGRRWRTFANGSPGPGTYEEAGRIAQGPQVCTRFHSTITKNMATTAPRTRWGGNPRHRTPGPGSYRPPSDFGYLDVKQRMTDHFYRGNHDVVGDLSSVPDQEDSIIEKATEAGLALKIEKMASHAISIQSDGKKSRRRNSNFKTVEVAEAQTSRPIHIKKENSNTYDGIPVDDLGIT